MICPTCEILARELTMLVILTWQDRHSNICTCQRLTGCSGVKATAVWRCLKTGCTVHNNATKREDTAIAAHTRNHTQSKGGVGVGALPPTYTRHKKQTNKLYFDPSTGGQKQKKRAKLHTGSTPKQRGTLIVLLLTFRFRCPQRSMREGNHPPPRRGETSVLCLVPRR